MKSSRRLMTALAQLLPLGALGVSAALAATPDPPLAATVAEPDVAQRLAAIRAAVSELTAEEAGLPAGDSNILDAWWGNWHPGWRNGGWLNGWRPGWRNAPWGNWGNGWRNGPWGNWWRNW
jgi:rSAM-associated Gly-rich repeat protein